ncbi:unnamed protein product, partial [Mesorhabditis belari]|uniref:Uncharacterized protein n=1 Tax=Mesorhabditis belari TaxID=2138241 RepID=A0AAF3ETB1_9BILA
MLEMNLITHILVTPIMKSFYRSRVGACFINVPIQNGATLSVREPSTVSVRVLCDGSMVSSTGCEFTYIDENTDNSTHLNIQSLVDRMQLFVAAFNVPQFLNDSPLTTSTLNEETFLSIVRSLLQHQLKNPHLLQPHRNLPSRTLLHLAAALDYHRFTEYLLWWRRSLPYTRELDPLSRDSEGSTPLHLAVKARNFGTVKVLVKACRATVDVLDDRGRTPSDLTSDPGLSKLTARFEEVEKTSGIPTSMEDAEHMAATALWVFTNGETVTDERRQDTQMNRMSVHSSTSPASLREEREREANPMMIKISMDTADVHVPDSPKMADLFDAVTSPGVFVNDCVREKMAQLAQHIIDALPERIKADPPQNNAQMHSLDDHQAHHGFSFAGESPMFSSNGFVVPELDDYMNLHFGPSTSHQNSFSTKTIPSDDGMSINHSPTFRRSVSHLYPFGGRESFPSSRATTFESGSFDLDNSKDLGEFLNSEATTEIGPLQQQLGDLKLSESEQRDVYEAAKTIQRAYREYRCGFCSKTSSAPHAEAERNAAITIQSFYRRYKAFQYFKRLYNAAILVQKHFRMKKKDQSGSVESSDRVADRFTRSSNGGWEKHSDTGGVDG